MMKRLLFAPGFPPSIGGAQAFMMSRAKAAWDNLTVLAAKCDGYQEFDRQQPFRIFRFEYPWSSPRFGPLRRFFQLRVARQVLSRALKEDDYSVVELATPFPGAFVLTNRRRRFRLISFALGDDILRPLNTWYSRHIFRRVLREIDHIIAISQFTRNLLLANGCREDQVSIINPPIHERFRNMVDGTMLRKRFAGADHLLLTVSRLVPKKGIDRTIEAVARLSLEFPGLYYMVAGNGNREERLRLQSLAQRLGVSDRVHFLGRVPDDELPFVYAACDIYVMPTRMDLRKGDVEGYGIAYVEASSQGKPVIGPNIGGACDAILDGVTGYCIDPNNVDELVARLRDLIRNPELMKEMGMAGRKFAMRPTDWSPLLDLK